VFCPTIFWGDGSDPAHASYLAALARALDPAVRLFWTGDAVVTPRITRTAAKGYQAAVGRRLVLWDNYPCNDDAPTMHLGPLVGRDADLPDVVDGYMTNPMRRQNRLGRLPLATAADYARDPATYDPTASMRAAIDRLATTAEERAILIELVALYAGSIARGENQYFNPVRAAISQTTGRERAAGLRDLEALVGRFQAAFGDRYPVELDSLRSDLSYATGSG
jgi:hyaluronoglucosaminidase